MHFADRGAENLKKSWARFEVDVIVKRTVRRIADLLKMLSKSLDVILIAKNGLAHPFLAIDAHCLPSAPIEWKRSQRQQFKTRMKRRVFL